jgi:hypothetical protein
LENEEVAAWMTGFARGAKKWQKQGIGVKREIVRGKEIFF